MPDIYLIIYLYFCLVKYIWIVYPEDCIFVAFSVPQMKTKKLTPVEQLFNSYVLTLFEKLCVTTANGSSMQIYKIAINVEKKEICNKVLFLMSWKD